LSDGDEGLEALRQQHFPHNLWLLDRWHVTQAVRTFTVSHHAEFRRLMQPVYHADSEAALEALCTSPLRRQHPHELRALFGYLLGNRDGIDNWQQIPAGLRRTVGRRPARVKAGSGGVEKNLEVRINRRFKRQGRAGIRCGPNASSNSYKPTRSLAALVDGHVPAPHCSHHRALILRSRPFPVHNRALAERARVRSVPCDPGDRVTPT